MEIPFNYFLVFILVSISGGIEGLTIEFFEVESNNDVIIGSSVNISCGYTDLTALSPIPSVLFGKMNGTNSMIQLPESDHIYWTMMECFDKNGEKSQCGQDKIHVRKLQITNVTHEDEGLYVCIVAASTQVVVNATYPVYPRLCRAGYYCSHDNNIEEQCQAGSFNNYTGQFSPTACLVCPEKHFCPPGSSHALKCPQPEYYNQISDEIANVSVYGWKNADDCATCPLKEKCYNSSICSFICTWTDYIEVLIGQNITLQCNITQTSLIPQGIKWYTKNDNGTKLYINESYIDDDLDSTKFHIPVKTKPLTVTYFCGGIENYMNTSIEKKIVVVFYEDQSGNPKGPFRMWLLAIPLTLLVFVVFIIFVSLRRREQHKKRLSSEGNPLAISEVGDGCDDVFADRTSCHPLICKGSKLNTESKQKKDQHDLASYDVFICYSAADRKWVKDTLLKNLEKEGSIRACIDYRNFRIGETIIKNISDAVYQSKKTIAVLSPDFMESEYCKHELHTALSHMDNHSVIPILYQPCDVPDVLLDKTYLDWCNNDVSPHFWKQLIKAIRKDARINLNTNDTTA